MEAIYMLEIDVQASKSSKKSCIPAVYSSIHCYTAIIYMIYRAEICEIQGYRSKADIQPVYTDIRVECNKHRPKIDLQVFESLFGLCTSGIQFDIHENGPRYSLYTQIYVQRIYGFERRNGLRPNPLHNMYNNLMGGQNPLFWPTFRVWTGKGNLGLTAQWLEIWTRVQICLFLYFPLLLFICCID